MKKLIATILLLATLTTFLPVVPVSAAGDDWQTGWTITDGVVQDDEFGLKIIPDETSTTRAQFQKNTNADYETDYTLIMTVEEWANSKAEYQNNIILYLNLGGMQRIAMSVYADGISLGSANGSTGKIPVDIGTGTHTYRMISEEAGRILVDGKEIANIELEQFAANTTSLFFLPDVTYIDYYGETAAMGGTTEEAPVEEEKPVVEQKVENELTLPQTESFFWDFEDPNEPYMEGWEGPIDEWKWNDGMISYEGGDTHSGIIVQDKTFNPKGDFVWSMRMRAGTFMFIVLKTCTKGIRTFWRISEANNTGNIINENQVGRWSEWASEYKDFMEWHEYKIESSDNGRYYKYYIDDELIGEERGYDYGRGFNDTERYIYLSVSNGMSDKTRFDIDWMKLETGINKDLGLVMVSPQERYTPNGSAAPMAYPEYLEGKDIELQAKVNEGYEDREIPQIDYKMNGKVIATGYAPDYKAVLKNAAPGRYSVVAEYDNLSSYETYFNVLPKIEAELKATWQTNNKLNLSLKNTNKFKGVAAVEFLVDGQVVATDKTAPYGATVSSLTPETHNVAAVFRSESGLALETLYQEATPNLGNNMSVNYSNEIRYTVSGSNGTATVDLSNGNHRVFITHKPGELTVLTRDGEEIQKYGAGDFIVITNGPTAEVYRNGQLAFSYFLPKSTAVEKKTKDNGLKVTNLKVTIPENRDNYFVKRNVTDKAKVYSLQGLGDLYHNYNLDFVANKEDKARLVLQDGYYVTDVLVENGEVSVQESTFNGTKPHKTVLGKLPEDGSDAYVRVSVVDGVATSWIDGKFGASFRCANGVGKESLGVDVTKGNLPYVSVNKHTDYFVFEDDFKGKGEFESLDYWITDKVTADADTDAGQMTFYTSGSGQALMAAFVDDFDLETEMTVTSGKGLIGFKFGENTSTGIYNEIGYNYATKQFELIERYKTNVNKITAPGSLPLGKKVKMALKVRHTAEDKYVYLYVDGKLVLSGDLGHGKQRGRIGLIVNSGVVTLHSVKFAGDSKLNAMLNTIMDTTRKGNGNGGPNYEDGSFVEASGHTTYDNGKTWVYVNRPMDAGKGIEIQPTPDGDFMVAKGEYEIVGYDKTWWTTSFYLTDDPANPEKELVAVDPMDETVGYDGSFSHLGDRLRIGPSGRAYWPTSADQIYDEESGLWMGHSEQSGMETVFYSDDKGRTWKQTETELSHRTLGSAVHESNVLELPNGIVRFYFRNSLGWIRYVDSYDGGKTFDIDNIKSTPFLSVTNAFSVKYGYKTYNSFDYNTIYITWGYDNTNQHGNVQAPRSRYAMARSTDGGENWEFIGTLWEKNQENSTIAAMNAWMGESRDLLYAGMDVGDNDAADSELCGRMTINKAAVKPTKAFETVHTLSDYSSEMCRILPVHKIERTLVVNEATGNAVLQGEHLAGVVTNGAIAVDVAATFVGAHLGKAANGGVTFTRGEEVTTFDSSKITKKNGKQYISISAFAEAYGYNVEDIDGAKFISQFGGWSEGQISAFRYATDIFNDKI